MKHVTRFLLALFWVGASFALLQGQAGIVATGANSAEGATLVSLTAGQVAFLNVTAAGGSVSQGVQQPHYLVSVVEAPSLSLSCLLFPNPVEGDLTLRIEDFPSHELFFHLYDLNGRLLATGPLTTNDTCIPTASLPPATYLLRVSDGRSGSLSFQIVKTR